MVMAYGYRYGVGVCHRAVASVSIYGYCIGVWLVVRQGRRGMARAKARVQGCGYVVGLWCRGRCRAMVMARV